MICPDCGSTNVEEIDRGYFFCIDCGSEFSQESEELLEEEDELTLDALFSEEDEEDEMDIYDEFDEYREYPEEEEEEF